MIRIFCIEPLTTLKNLQKMTANTLINKRYILKDKLGEGGMGAVYRATDRLTGHDVAFKQVITADNTPVDTATLGSSMDMRLALASEFQVLASLRHPHIISVLDYGFDDEGQPFFTMSLLDEPQTLLEGGQDLRLPEQVTMLIQLLQALSYLHRRGIVHCDLKPANVLVDNGQVRVLDFGLATLRSRAEDTDIGGTLAYIAPELLQGGSVSEAADLYAVGVMMYELFVGHHPFQINDMGLLVQQIMNEDPNWDEFEKTAPLNQISGQIDPSSIYQLKAQQVGDHLIPPIQNLLAKNPEDRYQDADTVIQELCRTTSQPVPMESIAIRESFLQAADFIGRGSQQQKLVNALNQIIDTTAIVASPIYQEKTTFAELETDTGSWRREARKGSSWLIGGEAGVGKSRLLNELRIQALVRGILVLRGQEVSQGATPYVVWRDILQRLVLGSDLNDTEAGSLKAIVPNISTLLERDIPDPPPLEPEQAQQRLQDTIISLLRRESQPMLLILEDLHWSAESLDILRRINTLVHELPLVIVGSFRDDERPDLPETLTKM